MYHKQAQLLQLFLLKKKDGKKFLYCVNAGDSRCVLVSKKRIMRMSYDDRVEDPKEKKEYSNKEELYIREGFMDL